MEVIVEDIGDGATVPLMRRTDGNGGLQVVTKRDRLHRRAVIVYKTHKAKEAVRLRFEDGDEGAVNPCWLTPRSVVEKLGDLV